MRGPEIRRSSAAAARSRARSQRSSTAPPQSPSVGPFLNCSHAATIRPRTEMAVVPK